MRVILIGFGVLALIASCYPDPKVQPPEDDPVIVMPDGAARGTPEKRACEVLTTLGCKEGVSPKCEEAFRTAPASNVAAFSVDCVLAARSKTQARVCGVRCLL